MTTRLLVVGLLCAAAVAQAQGRGDNMTLAVSRDVRGDSDDQMVLPNHTVTVTPVVRFLTAEQGFDPRPLAFTDVMLLDADARASLGGVADISGGVSLLPKQPAGSKELIWQGARLGARYGFHCGSTNLGDRCRSPWRFALDLQNSLAPLARQQGQFSTSDLALEAKFYLDDTVFLRGAVGGSVSGLWWRNAGPAGGFGEVVTRAELVFRQRYAFAAWASMEVRVPVGAWNAGGFTPTTRVNAALGVAATYVDNWDLFAEVRIMDRGDFAAPGTTLGVLDGGFDQQQFIVGITRRIDLPKGGTRPSTEPES